MYSDRHSLTSKHQLKVNTLRQRLVLKLKTRVLLNFQRCMAAQVQVSHPQIQKLQHSRNKLKLFHLRVLLQVKEVPQVKQVLNSNNKTRKSRRDLRRKERREKWRRNSRRSRELSRLREEITHIYTCGLRSKQKSLISFSTKSVLKIVLIALQSLNLVILKLVLYMFLEC